MSGTGATVAGGAAAAAAAAIAQAIKASGAIVSLKPPEFQKILDRNSDGVVVIAQSRFFGTTYRYLTSYKGLAFHTKSKEPIPVPSTCEVIAADKIWIPG